MTQLSRKEASWILGALRLLGAFGVTEGGIRDVLTNEGEFPEPNEEEIDRLCEKVNCLNDLDIETLVRKLTPGERRRSDPPLTNAEQRFITQAHRNHKAALLREQAAGLIHKAEELERTDHG